MEKTLMETLKNASIKMILVWIIWFIFVLIWMDWFQKVNPSYQWVVIKWWELQKEVLINWWYPKIPLWTEIQEVYIAPVSTEGESEAVNERSPFRWLVPISKDWQEMNVDTQLEYIVTDPYKFRNMTWVTDPKIIEQRMLASQVRSLVYTYVTEYTWQDLVKWWLRAELQQRLFKSLSSWILTKRKCSHWEMIEDDITWEKIQSMDNCEIVESWKQKTIEQYWMSVTQVNLRKTKPNQSIIDSVEKAQIAKQDVLIAKQEKLIETERANKIIEKKRWETESAKLEAEAWAFKIEAEAIAKAEWVKAEANAQRELAKAQRELNDALKWSKDLIEYKRLEVDMINAEANLEWAKHPERAVPENVTIVWTDEAKDAKILIWLPSITTTTND
jgi:regulator of protease activity HflC (stomatin/prohibitin superfamily)